MVEVVEHDHHLGELGQLCLERLEEWHAEAPAMQRRQSGQIGEVRVDGGKPGQKSLGESDGVVVVFANLHPDESELGMGSRPLSEEH